MDHVGCPLLETLLLETLESEKINPKNQAKIINLLNRLKEHHLPTYEHSIRVGLMTRKIAEVAYLDPKAGVYASLHDIGKLEISSEILSKSKRFTKKDRRKIEPHVFKGYEILMNKDMPVSAWIALTHHMYQSEPYPSPEELPEFPISASRRNLFHTAETLARITAIADTYDASKYRRNDRTPEPQKIRELMTENNPELRRLIDALYEKGIMTLTPVRVQ